VRLDGPLRAPEYHCGVGHGAVLDVEQGDGPALLLRKCADPLPQLVVAAGQFE